MEHTILITGASGYLGGDLLSHLAREQLLPHKLYALVRTDQQAEAVKQHGAEPLSFSPRDAAAVREAILKHQINIVLYLIDSRKSVGQENFIQALSELKASTGMEVHFLHTTGAKMFSSHAGAPLDKEFSDTDPKLFEIQNQQKAPLPMMHEGVDTNNKIIELSESLGVRSYIFAPCIVYGKSESFGNPISIQTVAIVKAAKALRKVYRVDEGRPMWPVCHVSDNSGLFVQIVAKILSGENIGHGKSGYFLASPGSVVWDDLYSAIAKAMLARGLVTDEDVTLADDKILEAMGKAIDSPKEQVAMQLGGLCRFVPRHGKDIGWKPNYQAAHIVEAAEAEVELVLANIK